MKISGCFNGLGKLLVALLMVLPAGAAAQTYYGQIAPLFLKHCSGCHQKGEVGPFPLLSYKDVTSKSRQIEYVISNKLMPPWKADPSYRHFANENFLVDSEIVLVKKWISLGMPEGDKMQGNSLAVASSEKNLLNEGEYIEVKMPVKFTVNGNNDDWVVQFIAPVELPEGKNINNIRFVPDNRGAIHHANYKIVQYNKQYDRKIRPVVVSYPHNNPADDPYDEPFNVEDIIYYGGWLPGSSPMQWPPRCGFKVPQKFYVLFKIHYAPGTIDRTDQSALRLYVTPDTLEHYVQFRNIGSFGGIAETIPPLVLSPDSVKSFYASFTTPDTMQLMYFIPHMHLLGTNFWAYFIQPAGDTVPLIKIDDWDFNWQEFYHISPPQLIQPGSRIEIHGTFDNTSSNPKAVYLPPRWVRQGVKTFDEMLSMVMLYYSR